MGEAKRRKDMGLQPREKKIYNKESKVKFNQIFNKFPYLPIILGFSLLAI